MNWSRMLQGLFRRVQENDALRAERDKPAKSSKEWVPSEPVQSILRTLKQQRHRFEFSHDRIGNGVHRWENWYRARDKQTNRVLWLHTEFTRYKGVGFTASPGLTGEEARWIHEQYLKHIASVKARAARIDNARERAKLMQEYVK